MISVKGIVTKYRRFTSYIAYVAALTCFNVMVVLITYLLVTPLLVAPIQHKVNVLQRCKSSNNSLYKISKTDESWQSLMKSVKFVLPGGHFTPVNCVSVSKVAIIIPYGNREKQLRVFLKNIHQFLQLQNLEYGIFVIEMNPSLEINRGLLKNVGYHEASRLYGYDCFIFHDVDMIPQKIQNSYNCSSYPMHMSPAIDTRNYKIPYKEYFGGVVAFTREQFRLVNGYSNIYIGWGREDDDLRFRVLKANLSIITQPNDVGRYTKLTHPHAPVNKENFKLFEKRHQRYTSDGLVNLNYKRLAIQFRPLFTWIYIDI